MSRTIPPLVPCATWFGDFEKDTFSEVVAPLKQTDPRHRAFSLSRKPHTVIGMKIAIETARHRLAGDLSLLEIGIRALTNGEATIRGAPRSPVSDYPSGSWHQ